MKIAGFVKNSFVDYPSKISAVIFTLGCPFSCWYCHNKHIIGEVSKNLIKESEVFDFLNKRRGLIDAVVISGGEPTMQNDLIEFIQKVKKLGYLVKLDTNGVNPNVIQKLLDNNLLDYIAMDIKRSIDNYDSFSNGKINKKNILSSIEIIKNCNIDYEFRTTLIHQIDYEEFSSMLSLIKGAKNYYIQKCKYPVDMPVYITNSKANAEKFLEISKKIVNNCSLRGFD